MPGRASAVFSCILGHRRLKAFDSAERVGGQRRKFVPIGMAEISIGVLGNPDRQEYVGRKICRFIKSQYHLLHGEGHAYGGPAAERRMIAQIVLCRGVGGWIADPNCEIDRMRVGMLDGERAAQSLRAS